MSAFLSKAEIQAFLAAHGGRAWAHILQAEHQRGRELNRNQVRCYRNALNLNVPVQ